MESDFRSLWQLLLETAVSDSSPSLTCADCFSILEYLADISQDYDDKLHLIQKARQHLAACPDCQSYYQNRLDEMEAEVKQKKDQAKPDRASAES